MYYLLYFTLICEGVRFWKGQRHGRGKYYIYTDLMPFTEVVLIKGLHAKWHQFMFPLFLNSV